MSALLISSIRHMLREQKINFPLPGQPIPISRSERVAMRRRGRDVYENTDWSKFDMYDG